MPATSDNDLVLACKLVATANGSTHDENLKQLKAKAIAAQFEDNCDSFNIFSDRKVETSDDNPNITFYVKNDLRGLLSRENSRNKKLISADNSARRCSSMVSKEMFDTSCKESRLIRLDSLRRLRGIDRTYTSDLSTTDDMSCSTCLSEQSSTGGFRHIYQSSPRRPSLYSTKSSSSGELGLAPTERPRIARRRSLHTTNYVSEFLESSSTDQMRKIPRSASMRKLKHNSVDGMSRSEKMMMASAILSDRHLRKQKHNERKLTSQQLPPPMPTRIRRRNSATQN